MKTTRSDQNGISLNNLNTFSSGKVLRRKKKINHVIALDLKPNFQSLKKNVWLTETRIAIEILRVKGLSLPFHKDVL